MIEEEKEQEKKEKEKRRRKRKEVEEPAGTTNGFSSSTIPFNSSAQ